MVEAGNDACVAELVLRNAQRAGDFGLNDVSERWGGGSEVETSDEFVQG